MHMGPEGTVGGTASLLGREASGNWVVKRKSNRGSSGSGKTKLYPRTHNAGPHYIPLQKEATSEKTGLGTGEKAAPGPGLTH